MPTFYGAIDLAKNELRNAIVQNLGTAPATPLKGQIYFDSTGNILYWYSGTQWVAAQGGAGAVPSDTVTTQAVGDAAVPGVSALYSRGDHKHAREAFGAVIAQTAFGAASANGSATSVIRSDHTHGTPTHDAAAHSTIPLSTFAVPLNDISMNFKKITSLADPTGTADAATKNYVDNLAQGLDAKQSVKVATTANVTLSNSGTTIDGITIADGDRVLVKSQTAPAENGIYMATLAPPMTLGRANDANIWAELPSAYVWVEQGTVNGDTGWVCTSDQGGTLGTTAVNWSQFSGAAQISAGAGMTKTGNTLDVVGGTGITVNADNIQLDTAYTDGVYVNVAGDTMTGALNGSPDLNLQSNGGNVYIGTAAKTPGILNLVGTDGGGYGGSVRLYYGGSQQGALNVTPNKIALLANSPYTMTIDAYTEVALRVQPGGNSSSLKVQDTQVITTLPVVLPGNPTTALQATPKQYVDGLVTGVAKKYAAALTGTASPEVITHNLNTRDITLTVMNGASPYTAVEVDWDATTVNTATIRYNPNLGAGYRVVITG